MINLKNLVFIQPNSAFVSEAIPLGLGYVAAITKKYGSQVKIIDGSAAYADYSHEEMVKMCEDFKADAVGVVFTTSHIYQAYDLVNKLKKLNIPILGGGYHASKFPEEILERGVDIALRGDTDRTIVELLDYLEGKIKLEDIKGISYVKDGKIVHKVPQIPIANLDEIPYPDREAFILEDFGKTPKEIRIAMSTIITSRGCPFECSFCASQKTGYRYRSAENIIGEIRQVKERYGVTNFYFLDDTININRKRLIELCDALKKENITWRCNGRFDLMDEELLIKMKESGCKHISFGVESGDNYVLSRMKKRLTTEKILEKAKLVHGVGINQTVNFMFGFPYEKPEHIDNTIKLIKQLGPYVSDWSRGGLLIPFPGTTLYEEFKDEYGYDKWWLRPEEFMTEVRESDSRPLFKRFLFDDHGQLEEQGKFFTYSDDVKAKIREGIRVLDYMIMKKKAKALNFTNNKIMEKAIYAGMVGIVNASKFLYHINPKLELKVIQPIHYALRRSRIYRDAQYS